MDGWMESSSKLFGENIRKQCCACKVKEATRKWLRHNFQLHSSFFSSAEVCRLLGLDKCVFHPVCTEGSINSHGGEMSVSSVPAGPLFAAAATFSICFHSVKCFYYSSRPNIKKQLLLHTTEVTMIFVYMTILFYSTMCLIHYSMSFYLYASNLLSLINDLWENNSN